MKTFIVVLKMVDGRFLPLEVRVAGGVTEAVAVGMSPENGAVNVMAVFAR